MPKKLLNGIGFFGIAFTCWIFLSGHNSRESYQGVPHRASTTTTDTDNFNGSLNVTHDTVQKTLDALDDSVGLAGPAGNDREFQFNDAGAMAGTTGLEWLAPLAGGCQGTKMEVATNLGDPCVGDTVLAHIISNQYSGGLSTFWAINDDESVSVHMAALGSGLPPTAALIASPQLLIQSDLIYMTDGSFGDSAFVGINTSSPDESLVVNGNMKLLSGGTTGNIYLPDVSAGSGATQGIIYTDLSGTPTPYIHSSGVQSFYAGVGAGGTLSTANDNVGIGVSTLSSVTTGTSNMCVGSLSCQFLTEGIDNVAMGDQALQANTDGNYNIAIGSKALFSAITDYNVGIGYHALQALQGIGGLSVAIGFEAAQAQTEAQSNIAIGYHALYSNTIGAGNTCVGNDSCLNMDGASNTTAIGNGAVTSLTTGESNTCVGSACLAGVDDGGDNVAIGFQAGLNAVDVDFNTFIGPSADVVNSIDDNNLQESSAIGYNAKVSEDNTMVLGQPGTILVNGDTEAPAGVQYYFKKPSGSLQAQFESPVDTANQIKQVRGTQDTYFGPSDTNEFHIYTGITDAGATPPSENMPLVISIGLSEHSRFEDGGLLIDTSNYIKLGAAGVQLSGDSDGALTIQGLGNGSDEDLTINLDDTANTASITSATGVNDIRFDAGTGNAQVTVDGSAGGSIMLRDTDDAGWTECFALNGVLSCTIDADGIADGA